MNILIVNTNNTFPPIFPIGAAYVLPNLLSRGHNIRFLDPSFRDTDWHILVQNEVALESTDIVFFIVRNIDTCNPSELHTCYDHINGLINAISDAYKKVTTIMVGAGFSILPTELMKKTGADFGIVGDGEEAVPMLVEAIEAGGDVSKIPGVVYRRTDNSICVSSPSRTKLETGLHRDSLQKLSVENYLKNSGCVGVPTRRGCPFNCSYCTYPIIEGSRFRLRHPMAVCKDIKVLVNCGFKHIWFVDSLFTLPKDQAHAICDELMRQELHKKIQWTAYATPLGFDFELAFKMKKAGCCELIFGTDSACDEMLLSLNKSFGWDEIRNATLAAQKAGLDFAHHLLFGAPGETPATAKITLQRMESLSCRLGLDFGIRIYPGTKICEQAIRAGTIKPDHNFLDPVFYVSPFVENQIDNILSDFNSTHDKCRYFGRDGHPHPYTSKELCETYQQGIIGPYWKILEEHLKTATSIDKKNIA